MWENRSCQSVFLGLLRLHVKCRRVGNGSCNKSVPWHSVVVVNYDSPVDWCWQSWDFEPSVPAGFVESKGDG